MPGLDPRRADLAVAGVDPARHDPPPARRRRAHALRSVAARRAGARLHRRGTASRSRRPIAIPTSGAAASSSWPSAATTGRSTRSRSRGSRSALFDQTRSVHGLTDREREWLEYARAPARHRRAHQLRAAPQALVLPDQERRSARLRAGGDRDRSRSSRAIIARRRRRSRTRATAICRGSARRDRPHARRRSCGWPKPRSQPRADDHGPRAARSRRRRPAAAADDAATPSSSSGPPPPRRAVRTHARQAAPHRSRQRHKDTAYAEQPDASRTSTRASCSSSRGSTGRARRRSWGCWRSG